MPGSGMGEWIQDFSRDGVSTAVFMRSLSIRALKGAGRGL